MSARSSMRARKRTTPKESLLGRLLDPIDRLTETIYSILILLTFTLAFGIIRVDGNAGQPIGAGSVNELLVAALGATLAWALSMV